VTDNNIFFPISFSLGFMVVFSLNSMSILSTDTRYRTSGGNFSVKSDRERLLDILEAIQLIEKYAAQGQKHFEESDLIQNWMVHHIQIIGEAATRLTQGTRSAYSKIPWTEIIGMRNILVHDYFGIDTEAI
jgi:uncharacterized protein with HEPN domain